MTKQRELERYLQEKKDSIVSLIPALHKAKALYGELTPDVQRFVADGLGLPLSRVAAAATFYSAFNGMDDGEADDRFLTPQKTGPMLEHPSGYAAARKYLKDDIDMIALLRAGKLRGRSGSGFPAADKWELTIHAESDVKYIVANGSEGEGDTYKDYLLMVQKPELIIEGVLICGLYTGIQKGVVYIRAEYDKAYASMQKAIAEAYAAGVLGENALGSGRRFDLEAVRGGGAYVCGEETALLEMLEGRRSEPRLKPPYPGTCGLYGKPTIINNVETFAASASLVLHGAEAFRAAGTPETGGTKLYTVSGAVERPGVYELPHSVTLREVMDLAGGQNVKGFQVGGGATGCFGSAAQLDTVLDYGSCRAAGLSLGTGAVRFIGADESVPKLALKSIAFLKDQSCGVCTACRYGLAELTELMRKLINGSGNEGMLSEAKRICAYVGQNSRCAHGQAAPLAFESAVRSFPAEFEALCRKEDEHEHFAL